MVPWYFVNLSGFFRSAPRRLLDRSHQPTHSCCCLCRSGKYLKENTILGKAGTTLLTGLAGLPEVSAQSSHTHTHAPQRRQRQHLYPVIGQQRQSLDIGQQYRELLFS